MEIEVLNDEKDKLVVEMSNQTVAELLRVYLNKQDGVELAAWKREHADKPVIFEILTKGKTARKALSDAIANIEKDTGKVLEEFKKSVK